jgi:hypothetical protein
VVCGTCWIGFVDAGESVNGIQWMSASRATALCELAGDSSHVWQHVLNLRVMKMPVGPYYVVKQFSTHEDGRFLGVQGLHRFQTQRPRYSCDSFITTTINGPGYIVY